MPTNPSPTANLPCEQCQYLNEPERVYCHNCGAKLDRSLLPKGEERRQESPEKARRRISKMTNPQAGWVGREAKMLFKVVIYAALLAAVYLVAQAPDGVPDPKKPSSMRLVSSDLSEAVEAPTPRAIAFSEDEVNQYLKQMLKAKEGIIPGVLFTRAFLNFRPSVARISSENSIWGYPVYAGIEYLPVVRNGQFSAEVVGGNFGRLAVHPQLMKYGEAAFQSLGTALQRERKMLAQMQSIKVEKESVSLLTKGAAAAR